MSEGIEPSAPVRQTSGSTYCSSTPIHPKMAPTTGFEPALLLGPVRQTGDLPEIYVGIKWSARWYSKPHYLLLRRQMLYPIELRAFEKDPQLDSVALRVFQCHHQEARAERSRKERPPAGKELQGVS